MISNSPNQTKIKSIVFYSFHADDALSALRMYGPARSAGLEIVRGTENGNVHIDAVTEGDLVIIQRDFCRDYESYSKIISQSHSQNKPVIIDLDDNLFELPLDHPDRLTGYYADSLLPTLQAVMEADLVTVASEPLREYLLPYNPNVRVIPNYLDDYLWRMSFQEPRGDAGDKIIIGYMGGQSHKPDLQMIVPVLLKLIEKYPNRILIRFWGIEAPLELAPFSQVDWFPPVFFRYEDFANAFQAQTADIMIAPLCENLFNSCKSSIKFLENSAIGVPGVYSRVAPYAEIVENGKDAFLASTIDEWIDGLVKLIESPDLRRELVKNAQQKIKQHWLLSKNANKRIKLYEEAITDYHRIKEISNPFYRLEKSLTEQYYEQQLRRDFNLKSLIAELAEKDENILSLNQRLADKDKDIISISQQFEDKDANISSIYQQLINKDENIRYLNQQLADKNENFVELNQLLAIKDENIVSLNQRLANKIENIISLTQQLADKEDNLLTLNQQLVNKDASILSLNQQLADTDASILSLNQQLTKKNELNLSLNQLSVDKDAKLYSLYQILADKDENILSLNQQLINKQNNVSALENEVLSYANSKSWRLTRPFREIRRQVKRVKNA